MLPIKVLHGGNRDFSRYYLLINAMHLYLHTSQCMPSRHPTNDFDYDESDCKIAF